MYRSINDTTGYTGEYHLGTLASDPHFVVNCLAGCERRGICKVDCPASSPPVNGNSGTCGSVVDDGANCTESCNSGFEAQGSAIRTCYRGNLSESTISCVPSCPAANQETPDCLLPGPCQVRTCEVTGGSGRDPYTRENQQKPLNSSCFFYDSVQTLR